jgi:hypothetical protein
MQLLYFEFIAFWPQIGGFGKLCIEKIKSAPQQRRLSKDYAGSCIV